MSLAVRDTATCDRFIQFTVQPPEVADAIDAYLKALIRVPSPALVNGGLSESAKRAQALERQAARSATPLPFTRT